MSRVRILTRPAKVAGLTFDDLYSEISDHWQYKAKRLRARRWRRLMQQIKTNPNFNNN